MENPKTNELIDENKKNVLQFDLNNQKSFIFDLINYMKNNYEEAKKLFTELIKLKQDGHIGWIHQAISKDSSDFNDIFNGNHLYKKYYNFFSLFDLITNADFIDMDVESVKIYFIEKEIDFWNYLEEYFVLALYIFNKLEKESIKNRDVFFDKVIFNLEKIQVLGINDFSIKIDNVDEKEHIVLEGQPFCAAKKMFLYHIVYYEENNFFTDGEFDDVYNRDKECVDVEIQNYDFIIKNGKIIYKDYDFESYSEIIVSDLTFDSSKLPSKEEIENTKSSLDSYLQMFYDKKCKLALSKLQKLNETLLDMFSQIDDLMDLFEDLQILDLVRENVDGDFSDVFLNDDLFMLSVISDGDAYNKTKKLLRNRTKKVE